MTTTSLTPEATAEASPDPAAASSPGGFVWAFVGQGFSSAANFGLAVLAGRLLGPSALGVVVIGYAAFQLVAGLVRSIVVQPLVAHGSPLAHTERRALATSGLTVVTVSGVAATFLLLACGLLVDGNIGRGLLIFAPWIVPGLLQEYWKAILFQEGNGALGAATDVVRLTTLAALVPVIVSWQHDYIVVGGWGLGATAGFLVGCVVFRLQPQRPSAAFGAWRAQAWALGRWLGAREVVFQLLTYATVLALAVILGTHDLGGLRSAEALFSPFSLIAAALVLPALPALSRAAATSHEHARAVALRVCAMATSVGLAYILVMVVVGRWLQSHLFGHAFSAFGNLLWPMAAAQILSAAGFSFTVLLSAEKRGRASLVAGAVGAAASFACATLLGWRYGVTGAAWGMAAGSAVGSAVVIQLGIRSGNGQLTSRRTSGSARAVNSRRPQLLYLVPGDICTPLVEQIGAMRHCYGYTRCGRDVRLLSLGTGSPWSLDHHETLKRRYGIDVDFRISRVPTLLRSPYPRPNHFRFWALLAAAPLAIEIQTRLALRPVDLVVHSRSPVMLAPFVALRSLLPRARRPRLILEIHEPPAATNAWIVRGVDLVLVNSLTLKRDVERGFGCPPGKVVFAPLAPYAPVSEEDRDEARAALGLPPLVPIVCYAGNLREEQGEFLLETAAHVRARIPDARLLIVGGTNGAAPERLKQRSLDESVIVTGQVDPANVGGYLAAADVLVHYMSDRLAWYRHCTPAKGWDYQAAARPIVGVGIPLFEEVFGPDGERAKRVDERTPQALADAVVGVLEDVDGSAAMARRAAEWIGAKTWDERCRLTLEALDAVAPVPSR